MNDFETVRHGIWSHSDDDCAEGEIALDRIEAEVERLTAHAENLGTALLEERAEVKRLQHEVARLAGWKVPPESELRAESKALIEGVAEHYKAKVERLRAALEREASARSLAVDLLMEDNVLSALSALEYPRDSTRAVLAKEEA